MRYFTGKLIVSDADNISGSMWLLGGHSHQSFHIKVPPWATVWPGISEYTKTVGPAVLYLK